jgi:hypothetical protein
MMIVTFGIESGREVMVMEAMAVRDLVRFGGHATPEAAAAEAAKVLGMPEAHARQLAEEAWLEVFGGCELCNAPNTQANDCQEMGVSHCIEGGYEIGSGTMVMCAACRAHGKSGQEPMPTRSVTPDSPWTNLNDCPF